MHKYLKFLLYVSLQFMEPFVTRFLLSIVFNTFLVLHSEVKFIYTNSAFQPSLPLPIIKTGGLSDNPLDNQTLML